LFRRRLAPHATPAARSTVSEFKRMKRIALFLAWCCAFCGQSQSAESESKTVLKTEHFDRDPGWDGVNNRVKVEKPIHVIQDFGFSATQHTGGKAPGEIGGRVQRSTTSAFYGMPLDAPKTFDNKLRCSGCFAVTDSGGLSSLYFGWFNTRTPGSRP